MATAQHTAAEPWHQWHHRRPLSAAACSGKVVPLANMIIHGSSHNRALPSCWFTKIPLSVWKQRSGCDSLILLDTLPKAGDTSLRSVKTAADAKNCTEVYFCSVQCLRWDSIGELPWSIAEISIVWIQPNILPHPRKNRREKPITLHWECFPIQLARKTRDLLVLLIFEPLCFSIPNYP